MKLVSKYEFSCVFVQVWTSPGFKARIHCLSRVQSCGESLGVKLLVGLPVVVLSSIWLTDCVTCFIVSSIISLWSVSNSEINCGETELNDTGVLCFIVDGTQIPFLKLKQVHIFLKKTMTENYLVEDKLLPVFQHGFLRPEENVDLHNVGVKCWRKC